jgi:hypothetical protein
VRLLILQSAGNMGTLTPGATLIYERTGDTVYSREAGSTERKVVGYDYKRDPLDYRNYMSDPNESQLWHDIRQAALTDKNLQEALDRVKVMYYLTHEAKTPVQHHPV